MPTPTSPSLVSSPRLDWFRTFLELPGDLEFNNLPVAHRGGLKNRVIDGKTMCGSGGGRTGIAALHMVSVFAVEHGICIAQQATDSKSNEITAIPQLLKILDLKGALVTIAALGCQKEIAKLVVEGEGEYILAVKGNQPHLHEDVKAILEPFLSGTQTSQPGTKTQTHENNKGREVTRTWSRRTTLGPP